MREPGLFDWFLYGPSLLFNVFPPAVFGVGFLFLSLFAYNHHQAKKGRTSDYRLLALPACMWILYGFWELHVRSLSNPIRIDLLLFAPALYVSPFIGLIPWLVSVRKTQKAERAQCAKK